MKVIVCFGDILILVPCEASEDITVKELSERAVTIFKKATNKSPDEEIKVTYLKTQSEGAVVDPDDKVANVAEDREIFIAVLEEPLAQVPIVNTSEQSNGTQITDSFIGSLLLRSRENLGQLLLMFVNVIMSLRTLLQNMSRQETCAVGSGATNAPRQQVQPQGTRAGCENGLEDSSLILKGENVPQENDAPERTDVESPVLKKKGIQIVPRTENGLLFVQDSTWTLLEQSGLPPSLDNHSDHEGYGSNTTSERPNTQEVPSAIEAISVPQDSGGFSFAVDELGSSHGAGGQEICINSIAVTEQGLSPFLGNDVPDNTDVESPVFKKKVSPVQKLGPSQPHVKRKKEIMSMFRMDENNVLRIKYPGFAEIYIVDPIKDNVDLVIMRDAGTITSRCYVRGPKIDGARHGDEILEVNGTAIYRMSYNHFVKKWNKILPNERVRLVIGRMMEDSHEGPSRRKSGGNTPS